MPAAGGLLQVFVNQGPDISGAVTAQLRGALIHSGQLCRGKAQCQNVCHTTSYYTETRHLATARFIRALPVA